MRFDACVGIDWSGAVAPGYRGVAVAVAEPGDAAPVLVAPPGPRWRRRDVLDWLQAETARGRRLLAGFDLAFALPEPFAPPPALWAEIEARCADDPDFAARRYADGDARFWARGPRPATWIDRPRPTEIACRDQGHGHPQTPLKLIGARQVGLGSLAGARLLHALRGSAAAQWQVWPFDGRPDGRRSVCVEIYPRLFIRGAGGGNAKLDGPALDAALVALGSRPAQRVVDDHQADALISAAGLRRHAGDDSLWDAGLGQPRGWIFGVAAPHATRAASGT